MPTGLRWDKDNWSCAYDSLFSILYNIWAESPEKWTKRFKSIGNIHLSSLTDGFKMVKLHMSLENVRDNIRIKLNEMDSAKFPMGEVGISVVTLAMEMLKPQDIVAYSCFVCSACNFTGPNCDDNLTYVLHADHTASDSTSKWVNKLQQNNDAECPNCNGQLFQRFCYKKTPNLLILDYPFCDIETSHMIAYKANGKTEFMDLKGVVYYGAYHFTSRFISDSGIIWYHDGMTTGSVFEKNITLKSTSDIDIKKCNNRGLTLAVYASRR
jgi:hypothetical protein